MRFFVAAVVAAGLLGALPAAAGNNDWGTWTFSGHGTSWSGTFIDAHYVQGITLGLKSLPRYNNVTSFKIGSHTCKLSSSHGDAYCYYLHLPPNKKLSWTLTTRKPLSTSDQIVPCIEWNKKYHCRYGNG